MTGCRRLKNNLSGFWLSGAERKKMTGLIHVVLLYDVIKKAVEVVQEGHHLHGGTDRAQGGEAYDVREED